MGKTWREKTTLAVEWASKVRIYPTVRRTPELADFVQSTAVYWKIPVEKVTEEMVKAHLRHNCTNYEARIAELAAIDRRYKLSEQDRYVARNLLKLSAITTAEKLFAKIIRRHRERESSLVAVE
jgi:hypothetical protein